MYIVERTNRDGEIVYWELTKSVPRDADGNPVEDGFIRNDGADTLTMIGEKDTLDVIVNFLKSRSTSDIRVTDVERAFKQANARGASADRRVRPTKRPQQKKVDYGRPAPSERPPPKRPLPSPVSILIALILIAAAIYYLTR